MRSFVLLALVALTAAELPAAAFPGLVPEKKGDCLVDGAEAVSDLMDSAMFIWAAVARCGKKGDATKCEINIASSIESINSMINLILKAVQKCGSMHFENEKCTLAASSLTESTAGIAAATGGIMEKCPGALAGIKHTTLSSLRAINWKHGPEVTCIVDVKNSMLGLFKAMKKLMKIKNGCTSLGSQTCVGTSLQVIEALAGLGQYLAGVLGHCAHDMKEAECGQHVGSLISSLSKGAKAGLDMSKACTLTPAQAQVAAAPIVTEVQVPRLYETYEVAEDKVGSAPMNFILAAFLPVAAVLGFVGGSRTAGRTHFNREIQEAPEDVETPMIQVQ